MATNKKTSALVDSLLPEFLADEGPKFQAFVRAYYEWLETTNQVTDRSKNLLNYQDLDNTADEFLEYFKREILSSFPQSILANKALVYKKIKDLYRAKGTEEAYKLLFRILFDEEIDFYYPGIDILRASDGRWQQNNTLRISGPFEGNPVNFVNEQITGQISGATATVVKVASTFESGIFVYELFLENISGTFTTDEQVRNEIHGLSGYIVSGIGPLTNVIVDFRGNNHQPGDGVKFIAASGIGANGIIIRTLDNALDVAVANGGSGYAVGTELDITGGGGSGAAFSVATISNTEVIPIYDDIISSFQNVPINTGPTFVSTGANTTSVSANLASSNVSSILSAALGTTNTTVGKIATLSFTSRGSNFISLPDVSARYDPVADLLLPDGSGGIKGDNATFTPSRVAGAIGEVRVVNPGSGYLRNEKLTLINTTRSGTINGTGAPEITGVIEYAGGYTDTKGFLSWNNKLQDNYFYQEFSYVIRSSKAIDVYRKLVTDAIHPAGTRLFGEKDIEEVISFDFEVEALNDLSIENLQSITSTLTFGEVRLSPTITPETIASTESLSTDHNLTFVIDPASIASTVIISTDIDVDMNIGGAELISIGSTIAIPTDLEVLQVGDGTVSNFQANTIGDLSAEQIADYDGITIGSLPGNRIFDGISTSFTTQLANGSTMFITDINDTGVEITVTVQSIDDANTLSITSNAVFANGDLAIISGGTYLYTT